MNYRDQSLLLIDGDEYIINKFTNNHLITTDYYDDNTSDVKLPWNTQNNLLAGRHRSPAGH